MAIPPSQIVSVPTTTTSVQLVNGACLVTGWSWRETTNSAGATIELYDGTGTGGNLLASITLVANESTRDLTATNGVVAENGVYLSVVSGSIKGALWAVVADRYGGPQVLIEHVIGWNVGVF